MRCPTCEYVLMAAGGSLCLSVKVAHTCVILSRLPIHMLWLVGWPGIRLLSRRQRHCCSWEPSCAAGACLHKHRAT